MSRRLRRKNQYPDEMPPLIRSLAQRLNASELAIEKTIRRCPRLASKTELDIEIALFANAEALGLSRDDFLRAVLKKPTLLLLDPQRLQTRMSELSNALDMTRADIVRIILRHPATAKRRPKALAANLANKAIMLGMTRSEFASLVIRQPTLLGIKAELLRRKLTKVEQVIKATGRSITVKDVIRQLPAALCYSDARLDSRRKLAEVMGSRIGIGHLFTLSEADLQFLQRQNDGSTKAL